MIPEVTLTGIKHFDFFLVFFSKIQYSPIGRSGGNVTIWRFLSGFQPIEQVLWSNMGPNPILGNPTDDRRGIPPHGRTPIPPEKGLDQGAPTKK